MSPSLARHAIFGLVGYCLISSVSANAFAGPYFNVDRPYVTTLSRSAVAQLNAARIAIIEMFTALDAGKGGEVTKQRSKAIGDLKGALGTFRQIEGRIGKLRRPLVIRAKTEDERVIVREFREALERRKIEFPTTERQLADLAVRTIGEYSDTIRNADLTGFPKHWQGVRKIVLAEINLLYVGNLASVVWVITAPRTRPKR